MVNEADIPRGADSGRASSRRAGGLSQRAGGGGFTVVDAAAVIVGKPLEVQADEQVIVPFTGRNAVALVRGEDARPTVVALENTGIEGDRISFLRLDGASLTPDRDATPAPQLDPGGLHREESSVAGGALVAAAAGALIIGLIVWALADGTTAIWGAVGGAALGGALGALWATFRRVGASAAWERSLHVEPDAQAVIAVHVDDDKGVQGAREVLGDRTWVFAHDGTVLQRP